MSHRIQENASQLLVLSCHLQSPQRDLLMGVLQRYGGKISNRLNSRFRERRSDRSQAPQDTSTQCYWRHDNFQGRPLQLLPRNKP